MEWHALLSPSSGKQFLACTPSAFLNRAYQNESSDASLEGTLAHAIAELMLRRFLKKVSAEQFDDAFRILTTVEFTSHNKTYDSKKYYNASMLHYAEAYVSTVLAALEPGAMLLVEERVYLDEYVPESSGTMDAGIFIFRKKLFKFFDLKYGKGVAVDALDNVQLKLYALGVLQTLGFMGEIDTFELNIYQPRNDIGHTVFRISTVELLQWAETYVKPRALLASKGEGETVAGSHCKFCAVKATCKALIAYSLSPEDFNYRSPHLISDTELLKLIERRDLMKIWIESIHEYMYKQALAGRKWPGYKLVEGISRRTITNEDQAADILRKQGFTDEVIYKPKELVNLGDIESLVGKSKVNGILGDVIFKTKGAIKLVPETDKAEEITPIADVFKNNPIQADDLDFLQ